MKNIVVISVLSFSFWSSAQYNGEHFIDLDDSSMVIEYLNGQWKFKQDGNKEKINFDFNTRSLQCIDSVNLNWYDNTITKYVLEWDGCCKIILKSYTIKNEQFDFIDEPYAYELWPIDSKTMAVNIGGDFGVYLLKKIKEE